MLAMNHTSSSNSNSSTAVQMKSNGPCAVLPTTPAISLHGSPTPFIVSQGNQQPQLLINCEFGGKYVITDSLEASTLYNCINKETHQEYVCKVCTRIYVLRLS